MSSCGTFTSKVGKSPSKRFQRFLGLLLAIALLSFSFQNASAASGITYTGRILKGDQPLDSGVVRFDVWVKTKDNCVLYYERRNIDMTGSGGTYSFEIGDANIIPGTQSFPQTGIQTISDLFNNTKSRANGDVDGSLQCATFNPASDEGRLMTVSFTPSGETAQALPDLAITAVPTAFQAFNANKVNGYGTGDLLKVDPSYTAKTTPNNPLSAAQYEEFWKLILGTSTTYLKAIPTLGGDVTGTLPAMTVVKIQNVAVTAPVTGDTGKVLTYNGTGMVWTTPSAGGITNLNGLTGATQSFVSGTTPLTISSSGSAHTFNISNASSSSSGLLTQTDWNTFNSKQSSALGSSQVWIGNASGGAQAQTLSGDATVNNSGVVTVDKTQSAQASKILQLDSSGNAYVAGVDIKGSSATAKLRFTGSTDMVMNLPTTSGTANQFLQTDGAGNLSWGSQSAMLPTISAGQVWVGNASNGAQAFSLTGDIASVSSTGVVTLSSSATGSNKLPLAGGTMSGAINMGGSNISNAGDVSLAAGKFLGLGVGSTAGTVTGQMWYDSGIIKYFDGTSVQSLGVAGAGITNLNGLSTGTQSLAIGTSGTVPTFNSSGSTHTLNIPMASSASVTAGLISNADYASIMAKQSNALATSQVWIGNASGAAEAHALSGDVFSVSTTGLVTVTKTTTGQSNTILALDGSGVANAYGFGVKGATSGTVALQAATATSNYALTLPAASPLNNQILKSDATGNLSWVTYLAQVSDSAPLTNGKMWIGNASGVASEVAMSGDATITNAGLLTLKNTGTIGTYTKVVTDAQGRVTSGSALASGDVTAALGYTPADAAAAGYVNGGNTFSGNATIGLKDNYNLGFKTNNNTYMTLTADGKLGIDTTNPISKLQIGNANATTDYGTTFLISGNGCPTCAGSARIVLEDRGASATTLAALTYGANNFAVGSLNSAGSVWNNSAILNINTATNVSTFSGVLNTQNVNIGAGNFLGLGAGSSAGTVAGQMWYDSGVIKYFDGTSAKSLGVAGAGITSLNGLTANIQSFVVGSAGNAPAITSVSSAHTLDIPMASASGSVTAGLISNPDYASMMAKQSNALADSFVWVGNASGAAQARALSGDVTISNVGLVSLKNTGTSGTYFKVVTDAQGRVTSGSALASGDVTAALGYTPTAGGSGYVNGGNSFTGNATIGLNDAYTLGFKTSNATRMTLDASGNLGLGTTTPGRKLHLQYTVNSGDDGIMLENLGNGGANFSLKSSGTGGHEYMLISTGSANSTGAGYFGIYDQSIPAYRMVIGPTGNVGFGTSAPGYTLDLGSRTDALRLPSGLDATRPANAAGLIRYNTTSNVVEYNNGTGWVSLGSSVGNTLAAGQMWVGNASGVAQAFSLSGDVASVSNTGSVVVNKTTTGANNTILSLDGTGVANAYGVGVKGATSGTVTLQAATTTANYSLKLPATTPVANQMMQSDASGNLSWVTALTSTTGYVNGGNSFNANATIGLNDNYNLGIKTAGSTRVTIDNTGNVGIGQTGPGSLLHITDSNKAVGSAQANVQIQSSTTGIDNGGTLTFSGEDGAVSGRMFATIAGRKENATSADYAGYFQIATRPNGGSLAERMRVDSTGKVGIGTTAPVSKLHIYSAANADNALSIGVAGSGTSERAKVDLLTLSDGNVLGGTTNNRGWAMTAYGNSYGTGDSNSLGFSFWGGATWTQTLRLEETGEVGIGTANPQYSLDFNGRTDAIRLPAGTTAQQPTAAAGLIRYNTSNSNIEFNNGSTWTALATGTGSGYVNGGNSFAGNATIGLNDAYNLSVKTNNATRMTFTGNGNIGILTTSPQAALHIADTNATSASYSPLTIGTNASTHVGIDFDSVQAYTGGSTSTLFLNYWGGDIGLGDGSKVKFDRTNSKLALNAGGSIDVTSTGTIATANGSISSTYGNIYTTSGKIGAGGAPTYSIDAGTNTDALRLPRGTTAQQPANAAGLIRYNTSNNNIEYNNGSGWSVLATSSGSSGAFVNGGNSFGTATSLGTNDGNALTLKTNGTTALTLDTSQNMSTAGDFTMTSGKSLMFGTSAYSFVNGTGGASSYLNFGTSGAIVMTLDVNGRVGIGTNPQFSLDLGSRTDSIRLPSGTDAQRPANTAGQLRYNTTSNAVEFNNGSTWTALGAGGGSGFVNGGNSFGGAATIGLNDNYSLGFRTNNATQMTLSNAGNLGVGTASPAAKVHIKGSAPTSVTVANEYLHLGGTEQVNGGYQVIGFGYYSSEAYPNAYMGLVQTSVAGSGKGDLVFGARNSTSDVAPSELMRINSAGGVGIGTSTINNNLSFSGQSAQKVGVERTTTAATVGSDFTITAGGAYTGGTNLAGGTLTLSSGTSTGTGGSQILLQTASSGTTGTADRAPATKVTISGTANSDTMAVAGTIRGTSVDNASSTTIDWSKGNTQYTAAGCTGTQYTFSNMRDGGVYTLAITGTFSANCTFGQTSPDTLSGTPGSGNFYFLPANSIPSGSNAIFSFMRVGSKVYVQWNSGFQN